MMKNYFFLTLITLITFNYTSFSQSPDVVINEVITDPQSDWSTNDFNGTAGSGTISDIDEAIELFIKTDGLDLTGWTLELLDGTDVIGDLTSSGAFSVSNYISTLGGTFTNTKNGDYLVLGNVAGSGAMNNSITINLKDNGGTIVDSVTLSGSGNAPNGNATSVSNESVLRIPNGVDTNDDAADFQQSTSSLGSENIDPSTLSNENLNDKLSGVKIYPNPVRDGKIFIKSSSNEVKDVKIYNILGRKVIDTKVNAGEEINVSDLSTGMYMISITENNKTLTKKVIIQ